MLFPLPVIRPLKQRKIRRAAHERLRMVFFMSASSLAAATANPWVRILDALEKKINRHSYETWLKPTRYSHADKGILFIRVPTAEFRRIGEKYADLIHEAMDDLGLEFQDVEFVTNTEENAQASQAAATPVRHDGGFPPASVTSAGARPASQVRFDWDGAAQLNPKYTFDNFV